MFRFSLTQLLMGTALVAILLVFTQTSGCETNRSVIESLSFSPDGSKIAVTKLNAQEGESPLVLNKIDLSRTISWIDAKTGSVNGIIHQDFIPGNSGQAHGLWQLGNASALCNPSSDVVTASVFGGVGLTHYSEDGANDFPEDQDVKHGVSNLAYSRSGRWLAASGFNFLTVLDLSDKVPPKRFDLNLLPLPFKNRLMLAFSQDETRLLIGTAMGLVMIDLNTDQEISTGLPKKNTLGCAFLPDDTLIDCFDDSVQRFDLSGQVVAELSKTRSCYICCADSEGRVAAVVSDSAILIFDLSSNTKVRTIGFPSARATALAFSSNGESLAVGDSEGKLSLFDVKTGNTLWTTSPPGRERWSWTYPFGFLMLWCLVAVILAKRSFKA